MLSFQILFGNIYGSIYIGVYNCTAILAYIKPPVFAVRLMGVFLAWQRFANRTRKRCVRFADRYHSYPCKSCFVSNKLHYFPKRPLVKLLICLGTKVFLFPDSSEITQDDCFYAVFNSQVNLSPGHRMKKVFKYVLLNSPVVNLYDEEGGMFG